MTGGQMKIEQTFGVGAGTPSRWRMRYYDIGPDRFSRAAAVDASADHGEGTGRRVSRAPAGTSREGGGGVRMSSLSVSRRIGERDRGRSVAPSFLFSTCSSSVATRRSICLSVLPFAFWRRLDGSPE
jgi:hypothetical protein